MASLRRGLGRFAGLADRQPAGAAFVAWVVIYIGLWVWAHFDTEPVLLARAEPARRDDIYTMFSSSTASMLAVTLTVLAILYALPDRPTIREARESSSWPALQGLLLSVALLCLVALVTAHIGVAVDHGKPGTEWLEFVLISSVTVATLALLIAGLVFAAVLYLASQPQDPSAGRGELAGMAE
jgi:hypothetical protein